MTPDGWTYTPQNRKPASKLQVGSLAERQFGLVTWAQLRALGVTEARISRWVGAGRLFPVYPRVYAVGHPRSDVAARLFSLVLFAGPGAALSHGTSAHWRGWLRYPVAATHVSTPRRIRTRMPSVAFHSRRDHERELVAGMPCTTATQTLLDLAATEPLKLVHRSLAQLDYRRALDPDRIRAACGQGRLGGAALLEALDSYIPQLAYTKSGLEDEFLYLCQGAGIPLPEVNTSVHGIEVDCHWPALKLVVELDGGGNHGTSPQRNRDRRRDLKLRRHGLPVIRYTEYQVFRSPEEVVADLREQCRPA